MKPIVTLLDKVFSATGGEHYQAVRKSMELASEARLLQDHDPAAATGLYLQATAKAPDIESKTFAWTGASKSYSDLREGASDKHSLLDKGSTTRQMFDDLDRLAPKQSELIEVLSPLSLVRELQYKVAYAAQSQP